jgi:cardiolipin synthase
MPLVRHAGHGNFPDLLVSGVRIFEYQSAILHAKTLVVDDYVSVVGSSNLDFRSFYFNAECNVLVLDDATGRTMAQAFEEDLGQSVEMRLDNLEPTAAGTSLWRCPGPLSQPAALIPARPWQ